MWNVLKGIIWIQACALNVLKLMLAAPSAPGIHVLSVKKAFTYTEAVVDHVLKIEDVSKDNARVLDVRSVKMDFT